MAWYSAVVNAKEFAASGCPPAGELEAPDWTEARVTCRSCARTLGHVQIRRGRARLNVECYRCHRTTVRVFPREWNPSGPPVIDGIAGTQVMRCARDHVLGTVEQEPEGVQSVWWLHCASCRKEMRWPAREREPGLTSAR